MRRVAPVVVVSDHTGSALALERYTTREERDMGTTNLIYVLLPRTRSLKTGPKTRT
jgi:hypothetical protein